MVTPVISFAPSEIQLRFQQELLTQGVNSKQAATVPDGVHRGFRLRPNTVTDLTIDVLADETFDDHSAALLSSSGEVVALRRSGGAFSLDLTAFAGTTIVLALVADYTVGRPTTVVLQAFELDPTDEFTSASDAVSGLGTVVVPASGLIPAANVTARFRREAWERQSDGGIQWAPALRNGGFERAVNGSTTATESRLAEHWFASATDNFVWGVTQQTANTGVQALELVAPSPSTMTTGLLRQYLNIPVRPQNYVRVELFVQLEQSVLAGSIQFELEFVDADDNAFTVTSRAVELPSVGPSFSRFIDVITIPAGSGQGIELLRKVEVQGLGIESSAAGDVLRIDDVGVWIETIGPTDDAPTDPYPERDVWGRDLNAAPLFLRDPTQDFDADYAQMRFDPASPAGEGGVVLEQARDVLLGNTIGPALRIANRLLVGESLLGTAADAARPRLSAEYTETLSTYTLIAESGPDGSSTGSVASRIYASDTGNLIFTVNARWNGSVWAMDDTSAIASQIRVQGGSTLILYKDPTAGTWTDDAPPTAGGWDNTAHTLAGDGTDTTMLLGGTTTGPGEQFFLSHVPSASVRLLQIFQTGLVLNQTLLTFGLFNSELLFDASNRTLDFLNSAGGTGVLNAFNGKLNFNANTLIATLFSILTVASVGGDAQVSLVDGLLQFTSIGAGSNPASTVGLSNELRALNTPKAWGRVVGGSPPTVEDGANITGVAASTVNFSGPTPVDSVQVQLASGFSSAADYGVLAIPRLTAFGNFTVSTVPQNVQVQNLSGTLFEVAIQQANNSWMLNTDTNFAFVFVVFGRQ